MSEAITIKIASPRQVTGGALGYHPVEPHARDPGVLVAPDEAVGLLLANPLREAVGILAVVWMLFVDGEIVIARDAAVGMSDGIDTRCLADAFDAVLGCRPQGVVAADDVVVVNDMVGV